MTLLQFAGVMAVVGCAAFVQKISGFGFGLIVVPLLPLLPEWRGAALWVAVAGLGLAAIIVATFIERGRAKVGAWVASLSETMNDWE